MAPGPACALVRDDLALLATGGLTGRERAALLAHIDGCVACAGELEELTSAVDALFHLVPEQEPPEGFAERTIERLRGERRVAPSGRIGRAVAVAAAVVALGLGIGLGTVIGSAGTAPAANGVRTASFVSSAGAGGQVIVSSGEYPWMFVTIDDSSAWGEVTCRVTLAGGAQRVVGRFPLGVGSESWSVRLPAPASSVQSVAVLDATGTTIATARLDR